MDTISDIVEWAGGHWAVCSAVVAAAVMPIGVFLYAQKSLYNRKDTSKKVGLVNFEKDMVYLHMFPRNVAKQVPNMSPFAMKLEMWLRIKKIPHKVVETFMWSKKRQSPFIIINGEEIADTNFIIDRLTSHFRLDESEGLDEERAAVSRAFLLLMEGNLIWTYFYWRYTENRLQFAKVFNIPMWKPIARLIRYSMGKGMKKRCFQIGIGRHTPDEIYSIAEKDLRAISQYLGSKHYFCGDEATLIDCCLFGNLGQIVYVKSLDYPQRRYIESHCPNIIRYLDRIKKNIWADWDEITSSGEFEI